MPALRLGAYEGPLDLLLDLARAQRVDLARISVLTLAEQFVAAVEAAIAGRRVPLSALGDWLVAAASLMVLRSRLLLPADTREGREAEREAAALRHRLADREAIRHLAAWLERRPQLGREVFGPGPREPAPPGPPLADITELLRACLRLLELPMHDRVYRPNPPVLWRVPDAIAQVRGLLAGLPPEGVRLAALLPAEARMATPLQRLRDAQRRDGHAARRGAGGRRGPPRGCHGGAVAWLRAGAGHQPVPGAAGARRARRGGPGARCGPRAPCRRGQGPSLAGRRLCRARDRDPDGGDAPAGGLGGRPAPRRAGRHCQLVGAWPC
jgi:segregation and condensation protein A